MVERAGWGPIDTNVKIVSAFVYQTVFFVNMKKELATIIFQSTAPIKRGR
jgi:hypothetical protein